MSPAFHIVLKQLMLRLLLANLAGLSVVSGYNFGYHPSAEEFDSLLRETRSWTRDLLAKQRQSDRESYVPRYDSKKTMLDFHTEQEPAIEQHVQSQLLEISDQQAAPVPGSTPNFPIFFTNPATGIVYVISEAGGQQPWPKNGSDSDAIAIYVTKEQYDADMESLRQRYEQQCQSPPISTPSRPITAASTARPQIIRLQKPKKTGSMPSHKPPPIMVPSGTKGSISDQLLKLKPSSTARPRAGPSRTPKPKRNKRRKKKKKPQKKRPGHKLPQPEPSTVGPKIMLGKRTKTTTTTPGTTSRPPTSQLEKPHMPQPTGTIFSEHPFVVSSGFIELPHRLKRRSLPDVLPDPQAGARPVSSGKRRPSGGGGGRRRSSSSGSGKLKKRPASPTLPPNQAQGGSGYRVPHAVHLLHSKHNDSSEHSKSRRRSAESNFDLFELFSGADDSYDDSYYDQEEQQHHRIKINVNLKQQEHQENSSSAEEGADFGAMEELPSNTSSSSTSSTTSSTMTPTSSEEEVKEQQDQSSSKQSLTKKRIKRRPNGQEQNSEEYFDEDDDEEEDDDSDTDTGISGFFRMIFYPVELAMSRLFDGIAGQTEESVELPSKPKYPTYTLYHSAHSNNDNVDEDDEDEDDSSSSSLSSWFSSWFGQRSRTKKKISSTTALPLVAPIPPPQTPAPDPPGWLESWFGFGDTTTQSSSEEDDYDRWFSGWFKATPKPKARRQKTTSTTSTTSTTTTMPVPQVPILTIVDPLRNPQNWIGILAHHIVNATGGGLSAAVSTTTNNPLVQALVTRGTSTTTTTTSQPELPRRISYDKYQIWRLKPQDEPQVRALEQFKKGEDGIKLQWLKGPSLRGLTDVLVPPKMLVDFQGTLNFEGIGHEVLIFDVGKAISYERTKEQYLYTTPVATRRPTKKPLSPPTLTWNKYYEHDDILKYLETMRMKHTQLVELIHIGRSYEGRPLIVVKIESKQTAAAATAAAAANHKRLKHKRRSGQANAVFIEAGAQSLAWIGPASATWMISELVRLMRTNKSDVDHEFIRNTTWYIMPVLNPDGYVYSHEYDRFWKKSRSQHVAKAPAGLLDSAMTWLQQKRTDDKICYGVDLDRNWLYHWGKRGSSKAPCNEFYAGPAPFSEPETKAVSEFLMDYRTQIKLYISLQAYGQIVSYPVKANSTFNTERMDDFLDVAMVGTDGLRKKGSKTRYKVDSANDLIEQRSGCADAFAAYEIGIPFSYTLQLADNGVHGYLLPSSAIESTARDAFDIISGMLDYI